jgi:hypothetical protein
MFGTIPITSIMDIYFSPFFTTNLDNIKFVCTFVRASSEPYFPCGQGWQ